MKVYNCNTKSIEPHLSIASAFQRMLCSSESGRLEQLSEEQHDAVRLLTNLIQLLSNKGILTAQELSLLRPGFAAYDFKDISDHRESFTDLGGKS